MRILVTGAGGFVGRHVVAALGEGGAEVLGVTRRPRMADHIPLDVGDRAAVWRIFRDYPVPEVVVHLAAIAHQKLGGMPDAAYDLVNHRGTRNILEAAGMAGVRRFIFVSSSTVYGQPADGKPVREEAAAAPRGAYARSKWAAEQACAEAAADGMDCAILRSPSVYSRSWLLNVRKRAYVPFTHNRLLLGIRGSQPMYSCCAIDNLTAAVALAVAGGISPGTYNIADAEPYTQAEIARVVGALDGVTRQVSLSRGAVRAAVAALASVSPSRVGDLLWSNYHKLMEGVVLDTARIRAYGFQPQARLRDLVPDAAAAPI